MNSSIQFRTTVPPVRKSSGRSPLRLAFLLIPLLLGCVALAQMARAQLSPEPDGGYPNANTAEGEDALFSLSIGIDNTAIGFDALHNNTTSSGNTAIGFQALYHNTTAATFGAGGANTATGAQALYFNTGGVLTTATGWRALYNNITGIINTATGAQALYSNTDGIGNTATGFSALNFNTTGSYNTANGDAALYNNTGGSFNTADGRDALFNNKTGSNNTGLGFGAGINLTTGDNNIDIGNAGVAAEANTIRIGTQRTQTNAYIAGIYNATVARGLGVVVDSTGHLGTKGSSARFKQHIKPMDKASEAIHALKPVTFCYKQELDPEGIPQFGLVAEDVEKVNPDLVARDDQGKVYTVRYEAVNAMLLNEFLKEHRRVEQQEATITRLKSTVAKQEATAARHQKQIEVLTTGLQKVSDQLELSRTAPRMVDNNQ